MSLERKIEPLVDSKQPDRLSLAIEEFISVQSNFKNTLEIITKEKFESDQLTEKEILNIENELAEYKKISHEFIETIPNLKKHSAEEISESPANHIKSICEYLDNNFSKINKFLLRLNKIYSEKLSKNQYIQSNKINEKLIIPNQHIVRYSLLIKNIIDNLQKSNIANRLESLELMEKTKIFLENKLDHEQLKSSLQLTPLKAEKIQKRRMTKKNNSYSDIFILNNLMLFFEGITITPDNKAYVYRVKTLIYAHSFSPETPSDKPESTLKNLIESINFSTKEHKFIFEEEKFITLNNIFKNKPPSQEISEENKQIHIENFHKEIENVFIKTLIEAANDLNHENYKRDFIEFLENSTKRDESILLRDQIIQKLSRLNSKYSIDESSILKNPNLKNFFDTFELLKKHSNPYFIKNSNTPLYNPAKKPKKVTNFSAAVFLLGKENTKSDFFEIKFDLLFINLLRIYNFYSDNELGKYLCQKEKIFPISTKGWIDILMILIKNAFFIYCDESIKQENKVNRLTKEIDACITQIKITPFAGNAVNSILNQNISQSQLLNSLKILHDHYSLGKYKKFQSENLNYCLPNQVIKPKPNENIHEYFEQTFLLFLQEKLAIHTSPISEETKKQLQIWCYIGDLDNNSEQRLASIKSIIQSKEPSWPLDSANFYECLKIYFEIQHKERNAKNLEMLSQNPVKSTISVLGQFSQTIVKSMQIPIPHQIDVYSEIIQILDEINCKTSAENANHPASPHTS